MNDSKKNLPPPRIVDKFLQWLLPEHLLEDVQGDLHEVFYKQAAKLGEDKAREEYILAAIRYIRPYFFKRRKKQAFHPKSLFIDMFSNYLKIVLRNMGRRKAFSFINISGLSVALACCMLILLYNKDEVSFDRFHENKDRLFRISTIHLGADKQVSKTGSTNMIVGPSFKQEIPQIETFVRMQSDWNTVRVGRKIFNQEVLFADEDFFSVFSFPFIAGNPGQALKDIHSVVLTEETAIKYFGTTQVLGQTLEIGEKFEPFIVTGVAKNPPQNSSIQFSMVFSYNYTAQKYPDNEWLGFYINTFVLLQPEADVKSIEPQLNKVFLSKAGEELRRAREHGFNSHIQFVLQPLLQIHLDTEYGDIRNGLANGSHPVYSEILTCIALFILVIACINFVNLTTAHSLRRGKEIGIRKVLGSRRSQLIRQFLSESFICCFLAFVLAIILVKLSLPLFNELTNKRLSFSYLLDVKMIVASCALLLVTSLAAGFYPALVLSGFQPVQTLYKRHTLTNQKNYLAKGMVVVQFALATFLMICTVVVYFQFDFLTSKDLGYTTDNIVQVHLGRGRQDELVKLFKTELAKEPNVEIVAVKNFGQNYTVVDVDNKTIDFAISWIDENYLPTLQIPMVAGRNFSKNMPSDAENSIIINETFAREAGWRDPVGKQLYKINGQEKYMTVIGVVKDHHFNSLKEKIKPQLFQLGAGDLWVKVKPDNIPQAIKTIQQTYHKLVPYRPFEYTFLDQFIEKQYAEEARWKQIIGFAAILSIFIACIGLFGLATLSIGQRTKEIGIRKVFGASLSDMVLLLTSEFILLVGIAFFVAVPLGYYAASRWIENFAYSIDLSWWIFALCGLLALLTALVTVSSQAIKSALANPVHVLRNE